MMVLGIVATLAALALPTYVNSHQRAKTVAEETERQQAEVQRQLEEFLASDTPPVITAP
jgi:type II secretory pathway pseudopilin PulG